MNVNKMQIERISSSLIDNLMTCYNTYTGPCVESASKTLWSSMNSSILGRGCITGSVFGLCSPLISSLHPVILKMPSLMSNVYPMSPGVSELNGTHLLPSAMQEITSSSEH